MRENYFTDLVIICEAQCWHPELIHIYMPGWSTTIKQYKARVKQSSRTFLECRVTVWPEGMWGVTNYKSSWLRILGTSGGLAAVWLTTILLTSILSIISFYFLHIWIRVPWAGSSRVFFYQNHNYNIFFCQVQTKL